MIGVNVKATAKMSVCTLRSTAVVNIKSQRIAGTAMMISIKREMTRSTKPPKKPAARARVMPTAMVRATAPNPMSRVGRPP